MLWSCPIPHMGDNSEEEELSTQARLGRWWWDWIMSGFGRRTHSCVRSWREVVQRMRVIFFDGQDFLWGGLKRGAGLSAGMCSDLQYGQKQGWLGLHGNSTHGNKCMSGALWGVPGSAALLSYAGLQSKAALTWSRLTFRTPTQHHGQKLDW